MSNVEIGVAAATADSAMITAVVRTIVRVFAFVSSVRESQAVTPILTLLRQGRSSLSAIPGNINMTSREGLAALA